MRTSINPFCGQIAASRARSLLACCHDTVCAAFGAGMAASGCSRERLLRSNVSQPLSDMSRRSLCGSLRFVPQNEFLEALK